MGRDFFTVASQLQAFLLSLVIGVFIGIFYDLFRILRLSFTENKLVIIVQDILFWSVSAFASFVFVFVVNNGAFRAYLAIGEALGFVVYYFTLGAVVIKVSDWFVQRIKRFFRFILHVLLFPFKRLYVVLTPKWKKMYKITKKKRKNSTSILKFSLKRSCYMLYNKSVNK